MIPRRKSPNSWRIPGPRERRLKSLEPSDIVPRKTGENRPKIALDRLRRFPYLPATTRATGLNPNRFTCVEHTSVSTSGWVCLGNCTRFLRTSEAGGRQGCRPHASITRKSGEPFPASFSSARTGLGRAALKEENRLAGAARSAARCVHSRATNRSRKRMVSFAPLGPDLSGGIFLR